MHYFIYSRKSVYTGKGESIENQVTLCRAYILASFPGASEEDIQVFEDEGCSGKNLDRPQLRAMMARLDRDRPACVVCYRLDRISRSVGDFAGLIETLRRKGVAFVCIREKFDTSTPMGKAMMYIASVFAQLERETIAERVRDNMRLLAGTGRWLGGQTPLGYTARRVEEVIVDGRVKRSCRLASCPEELEDVRRIFDIFLALGTLRGTAQRLERLGVRSRGGRALSPQAVRDILQNPVYCAADEAAWSYFTRLGAQVCFSARECAPERGLLGYNKRDYTGEGAARNPVEKWIIAVGKHPALLPGARWTAVQAILGMHPARPAAPHNRYALLSGLVRCGACGGPMLPKARSGRGEGQFDYICAAKLRGGRAACGGPNLPGPQADALAEGLVRALRPWGPGLGERLEHLCPARAPCPARSREGRRLLELLEQAKAGPDLLRRVEEQLAAPETEGEGPEHARDGAPPALAGWEDLWAGMTLEERRALLRLAVGECTWDGQALHFYSPFAPPEDVALSVEAHSRL